MFGGDTLINITQIIGWYSLNVGIFRKKHILEIKCRFLFADTDMKLGSIDDYYSFYESERYREGVGSGAWEWREGVREREERIVVTEKN